MANEADELEARLARLARAEGTTGLRQFALACAQAVAGHGSTPPLWNDALALLDGRISGELSEVTFRHRAGALICRFPILATIRGLRQSDPRAAAGLTVAASLGEDPLEAAIHSARAERVRAALAAHCFTLAGLQSWQTARDDDAAQNRAMARCLLQQLQRLTKSSSG